ncbi:MAG: putative alcohol dehydrogenase, Zn-containing, partial [Frankiales bacterium]|nr:putative alcohol dehydrogenase, Zn-containing [Frankiales bacterium]
MTMAAQGADRWGTRTIQGAVLERLGAPRPYARSRPLSVGDVQLEGPGPGEVLVRIEAAGVCHSDLSVVNGSRVRPVPMLLGHESAGIVLEVGAGVTDLPVGQRVVMAFVPRCEDCAGCRTDGKLPCGPGSAANGAGTLLGGARRLSREGELLHHHLGVSGFATHAVVDRHSVVPVGNDVPPDIAAVLGCAVLTGGGAVLNVGRPSEDQVVAVVGLGGVGMAALLTALSLGVRHVVGIDSLPDKLASAKALGAHAVFTPADAAASGLRA